MKFTSTSRITQRRLAGTLALVLAIACRDDAQGPGSELINPPPPPLLAALIVSNPAVSGLAAGRAAALNASAAGLIYASLPPGTFPTGEWMVIGNRRTGVRDTVLLVNGGVDPFPVAADVGDTLDISICLAGQGGVLQFTKIVPQRRPPVIVRTDPPAGKRDVPLNSVIILVFSEPIKPATLTASSVQLLLGGALVAGTLAFETTDQIIVTFTPAAPLAAGADYALLVTPAIEDLDGDALEAPVTMTFTTGDVTPPVTQLAFVRDGQIYLVNSDGTGLVQLSNGPNDADPAWSSDGRRIAFSRGQNTSRDIYIMDADGSNVVQRTHGGYNDAPTWSPDGQRIAFAAMGGGSLNVYVMPAEDDGTSPIAVVQRPGYDGQPAWSPDGTVLSFASDWIAYDFTSDIFVTPPSGFPITQLTNGFGFGGSLIEYYQPAWSPHDQRLAVVTCLIAFETCAASTLSVMNADGSGLTALTTTNGFAGPAWSPDGSLIAFSSSGDIFSIRADGGGRGMIIANGSSPAWRP